MNLYSLPVDQKDLLILYYLRKDARMPFAELAKKIDLTAPAVAYRVKKLVANNIIHKFTISIDQMKLTPTYQSYLVEFAFDNDKLENISQVLKSSRIFDELHILASSRSLIGVTSPLSNVELKGLVNIIAQLSLNEYNITPIIETLEINSEGEISSENIVNYYCPECQKEFSGEGFIDAVGLKVFAFCCIDCRDEFKEKYLKTIYE